MTWSDMVTYLTLFHWSFPNMQIKFYYFSIVPIHPRLQGGAFSAPAGNRTGIQRTMAEKLFTKASKVTTLRGG